MTITNLMTHYESFVKFKDYKDSVILIMSPNELKILTEGIKEVLQ